MRIVRFVNEQGQLRVGVDLGDDRADVFDLPDPLDPDAKPSGRIEAIATRLAPLQPVNIFCIGLNYREHAAETGASLPEYPVIFMKPVTAVNHPDHPIRLPACSQRGPEVDYECELAVVIGRQGRNISEDKALDYVRGYTVANDVSARRWQKHGGGGQWIRGKGFDSFCPLGPVMVTSDELKDPQTLALTTTLNGQVMQQGHSSDMIFTVAQLIAFISQDTTLLPGTVILTGTPSGVGVARDPKVFLKPGDDLTVAIEQIGALHNPVMDAERG